MDYEQAVQAGELVRLRRELDKARKECDRALKALRQSKQDGTWTEAMSAEYWQGPFMRFQTLEAQVLGLAPIQQSTIDTLTGRKG